MGVSLIYAHAGLVSTSSVEIKISALDFANSKVYFILPMRKAYKYRAFIELGGTRLK
jgi:hypothetical protein